MDLLLNKVQANLFISHKKKFAAHISFRWKNSEESSLKVDRLRWLLGIVEDMPGLTSHNDQLAGVDLIVNVYLSIFGYRKLDLPKDGFIPEFPNWNSQTEEYDDEPFQNNVLYDPTAVLDDPLVNSKSDGLILLAANERKLIYDLYEKLFANELFDCQDIKIYWGCRKTRKDKQGKIYSVGPLGFKDGITNPRQKDEIKQSGLVFYNTHSKPKLAGTYVAIILFEMDMSAFLATVTKVAMQIIEQIKEEVVVYSVTLGEIFSFAKSLFMGRDESGTPLKKQMEEVGGDEKVNFRRDLNGYYCPYRAHVRSLNYVNGLPLNHQIIRRGINWVSEDDPTDQRGLIFLSYQKDLQSQLFEGLYKSLEANNDFITYLNPNSDMKIELDVQLPWIDKKVSLVLEESDLNFKRYGGEGYYFAPTFTFFEHLSKHLYSLNL